MVSEFILLYKIVLTNKYALETTNSVYKIEIYMLLPMKLNLVYVSKVSTKQ